MDFVSGDDTNVSLLWMISALRLTFLLKRSWSNLASVMAGGRMVNAEVYSLAGEMSFQVSFLRPIAIFDLSSLEVVLN